MMHPVGELSPSVYWRRRMLMVAAVALALVSIWALLGRGGASKPSAAGSTSGISSPPSTPRTAAASSTQASSASASRTTSTPLAMCTAAQLSLAAASDAPQYSVGSKPKLALLVVNRGPAACVADLADPRIELRVFSGSARIWGSHDCAVQPGKSLQTLPVGKQIRREIEWSGLSSQVGCAGVRQQVPSGSYTLSALLGGKQGTTAQFSFSG